MRLTEDVFVERIFHDFPIYGFEVFGNENPFPSSESDIIECFFGPVELMNVFSVIVEKTYGIFQLCATSLRKIFVWSTCTSFTFIEVSGLKKRFAS